MLGGAQITETRARARAGDAGIGPSDARVARRSVSALPGGEGRAPSALAVQGERMVRDLESEAVRDGALTLLDALVENSSTRPQSMHTMWSWCVPSFNSKTAVPPSK